MNYSVKAAAMATGVSESRLRTWERRYGIPRPPRSATGRRTYGEADLAVIRRMAELVEAGITPAEAAVVASSHAAGAAAPEGSTPPFFAHPLALALEQASANFDEPGALETLRSAVETLGWADALDQVLMPALRSIGDAWEENEAVPANEHFASEIVRRELAGATAQLETPPSNAPLVLLACPEGERHELGLLALNLLLRRQRLRVVYLGADVPFADLVATIRQMSPDAVCLSVTSRGGLASLGRTTRALVAARASTRIFIGGPAVHTTRLEATIPGVLLPRPLAAAAQFVAEELGD